MGDSPAWTDQRGSFGAQALRWYLRYRHLVGVSWMELEGWGGFTLGERPVQRLELLPHGCICMLWRGFLRWPVPGDFVRWVVVAEVGVMIARFDRGESESAYLNMPLYDCHTTSRCHCEERR